MICLFVSRLLARSTRCVDMRCVPFDGLVVRTSPCHCRRNGTKEAEPRCIGCLPLALHLLARDCPGCHGCACFPLSPRIVFGLHIEWLSSALPFSREHARTFSEAAIEPTTREVSELTPRGIADADFQGCTLLSEAGGHWSARVSSSPTTSAQTAVRT